MKHLILSVLISFLFATAAYAEDEVTEQLIIEANEEGQVIVDETMSLDGNEYILNEAEPQQEYAVQMLSATTFSTNNYADGFFDNYRNLIQSNTLPAQAFDNVISATSYITWAQLNGANYRLTFTKPLDLTGFYYHLGGTSTSRTNINFYGESNNLIKSFTSQVGGGYNATKISNVKYITFSANGNQTLNDFDVFVDPVSIYSSVSNLAVKNIKHSSATVEWSNPIDGDFVDNAIYLDDVLIKNEITAQSFNLTDLNEDTEYKLTVRSNYGDGKFVQVNTNFRTAIDTSAQVDVSNLQVVQDGDAAVLNWDNPTNSSFKSLKIYRSGILIEDDFVGDTYTDEDIEKNINYRYTVIAVNRYGSASGGRSVRFTMAGEDVYNVKARATAADVVDITWSNPAHDELDTVKIYRKKNTSGIATFAALFNGGNDYQPLFQTNGTTFTDLTVAADSAYTYKLATVIASVENEGVEVEVKTPKVKVGGDTIDTETDANGDEFYVVKWTSPTSGKLKVLVGGAEYAVVNAADKEIKIPKADMVYTSLGTPDVSLVPVDDSGNEVGVPSQPSGGLGDISLSDAGLDASNILLITMGLLAIVLSIILLAMAFRVTPKILELIFSAFK